MVILFQVRSGDVQRPLVADNGPAHQRPTLVTSCAFRRSHATLSRNQFICITTSVCGYISNSNVVILANCLFFLLWKRCLLINMWLCANLPCGYVQNFYGYICGELT